MYSNCMNKEMEKIKEERLTRIKDYLVLFQWVDKCLDSEFEVKDISNIDFSKIEAAIEEDLEENKSE